jgi:peptidoglycan hydrolase-like protein with peptidoglycan-binding domain
LTSDEEKDDVAGKGFAGLSSMVSDVDATVASAQMAAAKPTSQTVPEPRSEPLSQAVEPPSGGSSTSKWLFGTAAAVGVLWLASLSNDKSSVPSSSPTIRTTPQTDASLVATNPSLQVPERLASPNRAAEAMPPIGTDVVLNSPQIRYCLAEDIRLGAAKGAVNDYNGSDVDRFNAMVSDYNSRCGQYRYKRGILEGLTIEIESYRASLAAEGRGRFEKSAGTPPRQSQSENAAPQPDFTVQAIQRRLNKLGYDAGGEDGFEGAKTRSAIASFQRDQKIMVDGKPSIALLARLSEQVVATEPPRKADSTLQPNLASQQAASLAQPTSSLITESGKPDLSRANAREQAAIERTCDGARQYSGPATYYSCLNRELSSVLSSGGRPDLSRATQAEQAAIERTCDGARQYSGPATYYSCLNRELSSVVSSGGRPDLSRATQAEQAAIERTCDGARQYSGPATYYSCLRRESSRLANR